MIKRVWRLGSLEHRITPNETAFQMLERAIQNGGSDLVWGPDINVIELRGGDDPSINFIDVATEENDDEIIFRCKKVKTL